MVASVVPPEAKARKQPDPTSERATDMFTIQIRDPASGREIRRLSGHPRLIAGWSGWGTQNLSNWWMEGVRLCFAPDGRTLASTADNDGRIHLWDIARGKEMFPDPGHPGEYDPIRFTPDGETVITGDLDGNLRLWDPWTGVERRRFADRVVGNRPGDLGRRGDAHLAGARRTRESLDVATGRELRQLTLPREPGLDSLEISSDGLDPDRRPDPPIGRRGHGSRAGRAPTCRPNSPTCVKFTPGGRTVVGAYGDHSWSAMWLGTDAAGELKCLESRETWANQKPGDLARRHQGGHRRSDDSRVGSGHRTEGCPIPRSGACPYRAWPSRRTGGRWPLAPYWFWSAHNHVASLGVGRMSWASC